MIKVKNRNLVDKVSRDRPTRQTSRLLVKGILRSSSMDSIRLLIPHQQPLSCCSTNSAHTSREHVKRRRRSVAAAIPDHLCRWCGACSVSTADAIRRSERLEVVKIGFVDRPTDRRHRRQKPAIPKCSVGVLHQFRHRRPASCHKAGSHFYAYRQPTVGVASMLPDYSR